MEDYQQQEYQFNMEGPDGFEYPFLAVYDYYPAKPKGLYPGYQEGVIIEKIKYWSQIDWSWIPVTDAAFERLATPELEKLILNTERKNHNVL